MMRRTPPLAGSAGHEAALPTGGQGNAARQASARERLDGLRSASASGGGSLPYANELEEAFQTDLSHVEAHTGVSDLPDRAGVQAAAFDDHVVFESDAPSREMVAHEVAHVLQPGGDAGWSTPGDSSERAADQAASRALSGGPVGDVGQATGLASGFPDPPTAFTWRMPFGLGNTTDHAGARPGLFEILRRLNNLSAMIGDGDASHDQFSAFFDELTSYAHQLSEDGPLTETEARNLTGFGQEVEPFHDAQLATVRRRLLDAVAPISSTSVEDTSGLEASLAEELHYAFIEGSVDRIGTLRDAITKVGEYNESVGRVLTWGSRVTGQIGMARTTDALQQFAGRSEALGEALGHVGQVVTAARALTTVVGLDNQAVGGTQNAINQFDAALSGIDVAMTFASGVPLLGALWTNYYLPASQACVRMLRVIARHTDREVRDYTLLSFMTQHREDDVAPRIPPELESNFPGGQSVFDFMFAVVHDLGPTVTPAVDRFFRQHHELLSAGLGERDRLETEGSHWYNPTTWGDAEHTTNLLPFLRAQKDRVWAMLYGDMPQR